MSSSQYKHPDASKRFSPSLLRLLFQPLQNGAKLESLQRKMVVHMISSSNKLSTSQMAKLLCSHGACGGDVPGPQHD
ncbi:hypothetical protein N7530_003961 [Penicillium desertorum]|uniref:Uncharacterized protein n=1 Tax=Penicillium desertorum TaxID=1303715 RepID=A0A9W9WXH3_9EURO|nr:hypothetical protein N7530_003961 [Penicillium desertorum]